METEIKEDMDLDDNGKEILKRMLESEQIKILESCEGKPFAEALIENLD